jgi:hypothetical protein
MFSVTVVTKKSITWTQSVCNKIFKKIIIHPNTVLTLLLVILARSQVTGRVKVLQTEGSCKLIVDIRKGAILQLGSWMRLKIPHIKKKVIQLYGLRLERNHLAKDRDRCRPLVKSAMNQKKKNTHFVMLRTNLRRNRYKNYIGFCQGPHHFLKTTENRKLCR